METLGAGEIKGDDPSSSKPLDSSRKPLDLGPRVDAHTGRVRHGSHLNFEKFKG